MRKVVALHPSLASPDLRSLVDSADLQRIQDEMAAETGLAIIMVDSVGTPVTNGSQFSGFCQLLRRDPRIRKLCMSCDAHGGLQAAIEGRPIVYKCHAGLVDFSIPILVGDSYIGAILAGQVLNSREQQAEAMGELNRQLQVAGDDAEKLMQQINVVHVDRLYQVADQLIQLTNQALGVSPGTVHTRFGAHLGAARQTASTDHGTGEPQLFEVDGLPALNHIATPQPKPLIDQDEMLRNLMERNISGNLDMLSRFLDDVLPHWSMKIKPSQLTGFEDAIIGLARTDGPMVAGEISRMVTSNRARRHGAINRYECQVYCERLLVKMHNLMEPDLADQDRSVATLINEIEKDPTSFLTVGKAAEYLNWSESHFSRRFKDETGLSFIQFVKDKRLEKAKLMLVHTTRPVSRIANQLGFRPENYFSRVFKKQTGMTPGEYRDKYTEEVA